MGRNRKRRYSEAATFGRTNRTSDFEEGRRRSESDKWSYDSQAFSPKRRRLTDTRGGESRGGGTFRIQGLGGNMESRFR